MGENPGVLQVLPAPIIVLPFTEADVDTAEPFVEPLDLTDIRKFRRVGGMAGTTWGWYRISSNPPFLGRNFIVPDCPWQITMILH